jgi:hypothetical protein
MARLLIGLSILSLLLVSCNSGPEVPDGFTEAEASPVTFAHPEDWSEGSPSGGAQLQIEASEEVGGATTGVQVFVDEEEGGDPSARATALAAELRTSVEDFEVIEQAETEVDGAESATLLEYSFSTPEGTAHSWDILAEGPDGEQVIFRVAGNEDNLSQETATQILDTLSFG